MTLAPGAKHEQRWRRTQPVVFYSFRALASLAVLGSVACSGVRLDPERNQALTFDTTESSDAGVASPLTMPAKRAAASQPAVTAQHEASAGPEGASLPAPAESNAPEPMRCTQDPPDPKPSSTKDWVAMDFTYANGTAQLQASRRVQSAKPRDSARVMGRYAVELWIGCELIDRVRFGFPLQAAETLPRNDGRHALHEPPSLTARAQLRATVLVPASERATRAELVDRSAGTRVSLAWPPALSSADAKKPSDEASASPK